VIVEFQYKRFLAETHSTQRKHYVDDAFAVSADTAKYSSSTKILVIGIYEAAVCEPAIRVHFITRQCRSSSEAAEIKTENCPSAADKNLT
jgi:hypothetical protein